MNIRTILLIFTSLCFTLVSAQITPTPALIQKAKEAGASQAQINAVIKSSQASEGIIENKNQIQTASPNTETQSRYDENEAPKASQQIIKTDNKENIIFGREIFNSRNLTFIPNYNIPTPKGYVLAAEDEIIIEVWGNSELNYKNTISSEGSINIPNLGPIYLNGLTIEDAEKRIKAKLSQIIGGLGYESHAKVSLGKIRSIKVNIAGEVVTPGTYTLPSLATLFNAIYSAGGVNDIGSLRDIKVFRANKQIANLDVYDYLINGKSETNIRLEDNDMIIISPYTNYVKVTGNVKRSRIYELKDGETLEKVIEYAGGVKGNAYTENIKITRKTGRFHSILTVDKVNFPTTKMADGDEVSIGEINDVFANRLIIQGAVSRPGDYEYSENLNTLSQLITKAEGLTGAEFTSRGQIIRTKADLTKEVIAFDLREITNGTKDISVMPEDIVYIPTTQSLQEDYFVRVIGEVNRPSTLEYKDNLTIGDVILMSGGLKESASLAKIDVARRIKNENATGYSPGSAQISSFSISKDLTLSDAVNDFLLEPFDEVIIRRSPSYSTQQNIMINGEVIFGGTYVLSNAGEKISSIVEKTGGFTPEAYIKGASLKRVRTKDEQAKVEAMLRIANQNKGKDSISVESLNIENTYTIGINLEKAMKNPGSSDDIILMEGDIIQIPKRSYTVKIAGAVLYSNTVTFNNKNIKKYISQAGGYAENARKRPFVVYMNGSVASTKRGFFHKRYPKIEPGCEIIVPTKQFKKSNLGLTDILGLSMSATSTAAMISTMMR